MRRVRKREARDKKRRQAAEDKGVGVERKEQPKARSRVHKEKKQGATQMVVKRKELREKQLRRC
jgi:hypothetical protein